MTTTPKTSIGTLVRRRALRLAELEHAAPVEYARWRAVETEIEQLTAGGELRFAKYRRQGDAILECLRQRDTWMTKTQIRDELLAGGLPGTDNENAPRLIIKAINQMIVRKQVITQPAESGKAKDDFVGLPEWEHRDKKK